MDEITYDESGRALDIKGRPRVDEMNDIEMLTEICQTLRAVGDVVNQFQGMSPGDMVRMLMVGGR